MTDAAAKANPMSGRIADVKKILVTGGTGKLGSRLVPALVRRGYAVCVVTPDAPGAFPDVEWHRQDFLDSIDFETAVAGCDVVMHLAAELNATDKMERVNVAATRSLVQAAERHGVRAFLYTSSSCVYGSPTRLVVSENCPLISTVPGDHADYYTTDYLKEYARTKLLGEIAIRDLGSDVAYTIVRPGNIVTERDIANVGTWNFLTRFWRGYRITHQIFVDDVVSAMIFLVERKLRLGKSAAANIEVFNISNDDDPENTYRAFLNKMYRATGARQYWSPIYSPAALDRIKDVIKFRSTNGWYSVGVIKYSSECLYATGFRYPVGISKAHRRVAAAKLI